MQEYADQVAALRPMLMRVARKRLRNDTWAEDAVSETLVAALEKPGAFAGRSTLQTWLVGILKHQTVNQIRRHTRECQVDIGEDETEFEKLSEAATDCASEARARLNDPQECLHQRQFITMFDACLTRLPPNQARAFMRVPLARRDKLGHLHQARRDDGQPPCNASQGKEPFACFGIGGFNYTVGPNFVNPIFGTLWHSH